MNENALFIVWSIAACSLVAVLLIYWRYRCKVRYYNKYIMKYIREHDLLAKELEYARIERDTMEKLLKTYFLETCKSLDAENRAAMSDTGGELNASILE